MSDDKCRYGFMEGLALALASALTLLNTWQAFGVMDRADALEARVAALEGKGQ